MHPQINLSALSEDKQKSAQQKHDLQNGYADYKIKAVSKENTFAHHLVSTCVAVFSVEITA
jgi:hypothetical protein